MRSLRIRVARFDDLAGHFFALETRLHRVRFMTVAKEEQIGPFTLLFTGDGWVILSSIACPQPRIEAPGLPGALSPRPGVVARAGFFFRWLDGQWRKSGTGEEH
jgi:hypothetical protein